MARRQSSHKVHHLKPSKPRQRTKRVRVDTIEQFYQPHSRQAVTVATVRWLRRDV